MLLFGKFLVFTLKLIVKYIKTQFCVQLVAQKNFHCNRGSLENLQNPLQSIAILMFYMVTIFFFSLTSSLQAKTILNVSEQMQEIIIIQIEIFISQSHIFNPSILREKKNLTEENYKEIKKESNLNKEVTQFQLSSPTNLPIIAQMCNTCSFELYGLFITRCTT